MYVRVCDVFISLYLLLMISIYLSFQYLIHNPLPCSKTNISLFQESYFIFRQVPKLVIELIRRD
jgi:hypothetical protein